MPGRKILCKLSTMRYGWFHPNMSVHAWLVWFPRCITATTCTTKLWSCSNSQICIIKSGVPTCVCREGRTGEDCKQSVYTICDLQCENDGRCMSTISGKKCECQSGWTGTLCNQRMKSNAKTPVLSIVFLAIIVILK